MKLSDQADAAARALDLLPPDDPAHSDPRLLRDPGLIGEARATREAAADLWLAVSPLRAAPPEVLHAVLEKVAGKEVSAPARSSRIARWLAVSGWAVAALVTLALWPGPAASPEGTVPVAANVPIRRDSAQEGTPRAAESVAQAERTRRHKELMELREKVELLRDERSANAPLVMSLRAPGAARRTPQETRERLWAVLTKALRSSLEVESGAPNDPASLVIERGWLPEGIPFAGDDLFLRHRNFPEASWQGLGLLRSDEGEYYDPERQLVWSPDLAGGGFIGRRFPKESIDLAIFRKPGEVAGKASDGSGQAPNAMAEPIGKIPRGEPEGFLIEDPVTKQAELVIDQVPAPTEGNTQVIEWVDAAGETGSVEVGMLASAANTGGSQAGQFSGNQFVMTPGVPPGYTVGFGTKPSSAYSRLFANAASGGPLTYTVATSFSNVGGFSSFQLVERPIIPDGTPDRVIVAGGE